MALLATSNANASDLFIARSMRDDCFIFIRNSAVLCKLIIYVLVLVFGNYLILCFTPRKLIRNKLFILFHVIKIRLNAKLKTIYSFTIKI